MRSPGTTTKSSPHLPQLEKAREQQQRPSTTKMNEEVNSLIKKYPPYLAGVQRKGHSVSKGELVVGPRASTSGQNGSQSLGQGSQIGVRYYSNPREGRQSLQPAGSGSDLPLYMFTLGMYALAQLETQLLLSASF